MAVDEVGSVGSQEHSGAHQVLGLAPAGSGGLGDDELVEGVTAAVGLDLAERSGLGSSDVAGADAVALDVVLAVLGADVAGEHLQAALCRCVGGDGLTAQLAHHGADVDDLAVALLDHAGDNMLCHDVGGNQVDIDDLAEVLGLHLQHGNTLDDAGVVDQDVNGAQVPLDVGHQLDHVLLVGDVGIVAVGVDALFMVGSHGGLHVMLAAAVESDLCAGGGIGLGDGKADAVSGAGDQSYLTLQGKLLHNIHCNHSPFCRLCGSHKMLIN